MTTKGPIEHTGGPTESRIQRAFPDEPQLYLIPKLGRKELTFIAKGIHEHEDLHTGTIDADDVSVVMEAGRHSDFGYVCHIDTKDGRGYLVKGKTWEVEKVLFGEEEDEVPF